MEVMNGNKLQNKGGNGDNMIYKRLERCRNGGIVRENGMKEVKKMNGINKRGRLSHIRSFDSVSKMNYYRSDSEPCTPLDNLNLEIDENILKVCKIYLKRSLFNDCKLVKLNPNYVEHIVDLIFNLGFLAKRAHFMRDILDLIKLIYVPESLLHDLQMSRNHRLSIFKGMAFNCNLSHPKMPIDMRRCKVLLIKYFTNGQQRDSYDSISSLISSSNSIKQFIDKIHRNNVQLIITENYVPYEISSNLSEKGICCITNVGSKTMDKLSFALNCSIMFSMDEDLNLASYTGLCESFRLNKTSVSIANLTFGEHFKGFTILISSRMIKSENLKRIRELIKISVVRLQGIVEELELIENLNGNFIVDTEVFDEDFRDGDDVCENFSDYLDMMLGNSARSSVSTSSPRSNLNYFSCDIYYNKIIESEITCNEYRKLTRLQCFEYYTKMNELCVRPTLETISIGNYDKGLFFTDFITKITNSMKVNKCKVNPKCSESFINHQLHFETAYSNIENMRLSLTFQVTSEKHDLFDGINIKTFCTICNHSENHKVQDLTFGRFLQLAMFNRSYRSKCDHLLFFNNKFSILVDNYSITFTLTPVSIYTIVPEFNQPLYNCCRDTLPFVRSLNTRFDQMFQKLNKQINHTLHFSSVDYGIENRMLNLYFKQDDLLNGSLLYFYSNIFKDVSTSFHKLMNYKIEDNLPCICKFSTISQDCDDKSQWLSLLKDMNFPEFLIKFEKHSAFGVEINFRLYERVRNCMESNCSIFTCEDCGLDAYLTLGDVEVLNWFYIFVHVINAFESKVVKLKSALSYIVKITKEFSGYYEIVKKSEDDLIGVFIQTISLLLYSKYFCPRDPMYIFLIVKSFFKSFYNICEVLLYEFRVISHLEQVSSLKILEFDKNNIVVVQSVGDVKSYCKIDFIKLECTEVDFDSEDSFVVYDIGEFLTFSQYFAILSGIQDLSNEVIKKSSYLKMVNRIRVIGDNSESIVCLDYKPIIQPSRDVSNILANTLSSKEYLYKFNNQIKCHLPLKSTSNYISYLSNCDLNYDNYSYSSFDCVNCDEKKGLVYNFMLINVTKRNLGSYIFKQNGFPFSNEIINGYIPIYRIEQLNHKRENRIYQLVVGEEYLNLEYKSINGEMKRRVPKCKYSLPFYGLPIIYTNSKTLNYKRMDIGKSIDFGYLNLFLYELFDKYCLNEQVNHKRVNRYINNDFRRYMFAKNVKRCNSNYLTSLKFQDRTNYTVINSDSSNNMAIDDVDVDEIEVYFGPYSVIVYYPSEFHNLRHKYCGDDLNFIRSLCRSTRMPSIGKSGSPIFMTYDGKFTIKLINKHEMSLFVSQGLEFFKYFEAKKTLMSLPYGLFKVTHIKTNSSINCFVMQNIDYFSHSKISFDLKGISLKRYISLENEASLNLKLRFSSNGSLDGGVNNVLLDQNFKLYTKGCPIQLDYDSINIINHRLKSDLNFLSSINIVDYSLLIRFLPSQSIITLGLIDFLRPYTWDKQIETVGKRLANIGQAPTIVSPNEYKSRFFNFIQNIFIYPYPSKDKKRVERVEQEVVKVVKDEKECRLCNGLNHVYSNSYFTCLKYFNSRLSPNLVQYLHMVYKSGKWDKGIDKAELDELVKLIENIHSSPIINWTKI